MTAADTSLTAVADEPFRMNERGALDTSSFRDWVYTATRAKLTEQVRAAGIAVPPGWVAQTADAVAVHVDALAHPILSDIVVKEARAAARLLLGEEETCG